MNLFTTNLPSFPAGLRVLAVDHDTYDLYTIHHICNQLQYQVTTCSTTSDAMCFLSEQYFDIIVIETHIPQQDTYGFVQQVTSRLKIPVIMMSLDNRTRSVMDSISNGACSYWSKPLDQNLFKNMWQHVVRQHVVQKAFSQSEAKGLKKRGRDDEVHVSKQPLAKKARLSWTDDLHKKFLSTVKQLGIDDAKPKIVLKIMDCPGLELKHVASHLQKFKMHLNGGIKKSKMKKFDFQGHNNYVVSAESIDSPGTSLPQLGQYSMSDQHCNESDIFFNLADFFPDLNDEIHNVTW